MSAKRDYMDKYLERMEGQKIEPTEGTHRADREPTESRQQSNFKKYRPTELQRLSIRLRSEDIEALREYFKSRDLALSQGLRTVIKDFMERQGL